jgi:peptide/nickel transport system permease protein
MTSPEIPEPGAINTPGSVVVDPLEEQAELLPAARRRRSVLQTFLHHRLAIVGLSFIVFIVLFCYVGPLLYHTNQIQSNLADLNRPPSGAHLLGTDEVGHDELGSLMVGGKASLEVGLAAALLAGVFGTAWGAISGYAGGWLDAVMMRIVDSMLSIPYLLLALVLASIFAPTVPVMIVIVAAISWLSTARLVRGQALSLRTREYVEAARGAGGRSWELVLRHIVPNAISTIVVQATFSVANAILLVASLSFLGLGPPAPSTNWGEMLSNGLNYVYDDYWWLIYPPGIAILLTVLAFNFIGQGLHDALDARIGGKS